MAERPHVICHMITGLDSRVDTSGWCPTEGVAKSLQSALYFDLLYGFGARGYLVGRVTMEPYATGSAEDPGGPAPDRTRFVAPQSDASLAVVLDPSGRLHWDSGLLDGDHLVMVLGPEVADGHLRELASRGVSYLVSPGADIDPAWVLDQLATHFGARAMIVAGGGIVNGLFLAAGLVDEISLLMVPAIDGRAEARNVFDSGATALKSLMQLSLIGAEPLDQQAVHLRYAVSRNT